MKKLIFSMLAMAAMVSCGSESDPINEVNPGEKVEIKLDAGVIATTKAPVEAWAGDKVNFAMKDKDAADFSADWYATIATGGTITFTDVNFTTTTTHYYNSDGSNTTLVGYYPADGDNKGTRTVNSVVFEIPAAADVDIMATASQTCSKATNNTFKMFEFKHLLTQLSFKAVSEAGYTGGDITSVTLNGTKRKATLDLGTPATLAFAGGTSGDAVTVYSDATGFLLGATAKPIGNIVMVQPGVTITLDIVAGSTTFSNIPITTKETDGLAIIGKSYEITLTFSGKTIEATAGLADWGTPGGGSGTVQ